MHTATDHPDPLTPDALDNLRTATATVQARPTAVGYDVLADRYWAAAWEAMSRAAQCRGTVGAGV